MVKLHVVKDFKKKKAKVGKKVEKSANTTRVNVKSKQLVVPTSSLLLESNSNVTCKESMEKQLKLLRHFTPSQRSGALRSLADIFSLNGDSSSKTTKLSLVAIMLPAALELLFDVDAECRECLLKLFSSVTAQYETVYLSSIGGILVSYCCSGLTNLHKVMIFVGLLICVCLPC